MRSVLPALLVLAGLGSVPAHAAGVTYTGTTSQERSIRLTLDGSEVAYEFSFAAECGGETITIPIEGTASVSGTGAFLDEESFAGGASTYRIVGNAGSGRTRTGTLTLTGAGCTALDLTWSARRPAIVGGGRCADPRPTRRLELSKATATGVGCGAARTAATRWATACYQAQWLQAAERCAFRSGGRRWSARQKVVGGPGSGGYSRITLTSGRAKVTVYAQARATS